MPYLRPELILDRFSAFARDDVRPSIVGEGDEFLEAQVGSMSSTMSFLSKELEGRGDAVETQREALLDALDGVEQVVDEADGDVDDVRTSVEATRERVSNAPRTDVYEHERVLVGASSDLLETVEEDLDRETAQAVREPLYGFLQTRVESQLVMLGRDER
ncbi:hypothetical protein ACFQPA_19330 [Halomarina halobia]|uniref:DUF47 family protein n=1 Tax=Halomarina halobia TaxID=3033386 RepID=A0ABD6ADE5_9EURY|nr:hypothetical protein [Halomarina sp. PSR21]